MTRRENSFFRMLYATAVVCKEYMAVWSGSATFSAAFGAGVTDVLSDLPDMLAQQEKGSKGFAEAKAENRAALEARLYDMASRVALYAATANKVTLQSEARLSPTAIRKAKDDALVGMVTRITSLATAHLAALGPFGVVAADVSALSAQGVAYAAQIGAPARMRSAAKEATAAIRTLMATARAQLALMDAHLVMWKESAPDFCAQYKICRRIVDAGFRTRALEVTVKNAQGAPVAGAKFSLPSAKLQRKTSARGICRVAHLPEGQHTARVSVDGLPVQEVAFHIGKGETTKLEIVV